MVLEFESQSLCLPAFPFCHLNCSIYLNGYGVPGSHMMKIILLPKIKFNNSIYAHSVFGYEPFHFVAILGIRNDFGLLATRWASVCAGGRKM